MFYIEALRALWLKYINKKENRTLFCNEFSKRKIVFKLKKCV